MRRQDGRRRRSGQRLELQRGQLRGSSGASSGASSGGIFNSRLQTSNSPPACISCIESQCGSQLALVESGCSDLLTCECPGGVYNQSLAQACSPKAQEPSCTGPVAQIDQCVTQLCVSACEVSSSSSGGGGSGGSGGSSSGVSSSSGGSSGGPPPPGCTTDATVACTGGAIGFACSVGDNPEVADPTLSCSTPSLTGGQDLYCCFSSGAWSSSTCEPDDTLTSVCPDPTTYGFVCASGDDPTSYDALLTCSTPTPDPDGVHDDFCCVYG